MLESYRDKGWQSLAHHLLNPPPSREGGYGKGTEIILLKRFIAVKSLILGILGVILLAGCGFEPLYVQKKHDNSWYFNGDFDTSISSEMAQIKVEPIAERFGQIVRNELIDSLTPHGVPSRPKYRLYVYLTDRTVTQQAMRKDITATREKVSYRVEYTLNLGDEVLLNGNSVVDVGYDILANPYSTTIAQKKTEKNAAKIIANDIALRLGAYFHTVITKKGQGLDFQNPAD